MPKRGNIYAYGGTWGGKRLRFSLGTKLPQAAKVLTRQIETALASGPDSDLWPTLKTILPTASYKILTEGRGLKTSPELAQFEQQFLDKLDRRVKLGELAESSRNHYSKTAIGFFDRMADTGVRKLDEITPTVLEDFIIWRKECLLAKGGSARGLITDTTIIKTIFDFALTERLISDSPVRGKYKSDADPPPPTPFTSEDMKRLEEVAGDDLGFLLLRWTGMRVSDVCALEWGAMDFTSKTLKWLTHKRKNWISVPLVPELLNRLEQETGYIPTDQVLKGITRGRLYAAIKDLGERAGVVDCHPHKFRTTLACYLLGKGASLFDVARLLGDSPGVVDRYYANVTNEQQQRVRNIMEG